MMKNILCFLLIASAACAQNVTIGPAIFSGLGLNDASSGGRFTTAPGNHVYVATISATGTPDHFKWSKDGGSLSIAIAITGSAQSLSDGVTITFAATTGHMLAASWTITATASGSLSTQSVIQSGVGAVFRDAQTKARETVSVKDFGAVGNDSTDDTASIQACIDYAAANRASCFAPPAIYKITGSGLHMLTGQPSLYGLQSMGEGIPCLKYYGTGTTLTIGDGTNRMFAINLQNICIEAADGVTAAKGIDVRNVSGGEWKGVTIGGGATTGTFSTAALRFVDSGLINISRLILSNQAYATGSGVLFDDSLLFANDDITIDATDMSNIEKMFNLRNCSHCTFTHFYVENSKHAIYIDNTSNQAALGNVIFDQGEFNTSGSGAPSHKVLTVIGAASQLLAVNNLRITNSRWFLSGGIVEPVSISINASPAAFSAFRLNLGHNVILGANTSVVASNSLLARLSFDTSWVRDNTAAIRTPNCLLASCVNAGTSSLDDHDPVNTSDTPLAYTDGAGNSTSVSETTGTIKIGGGTTINKYSTFSAMLDFAAPGSVPGCDIPLALTASSAVANSAPVFYSPPVNIPVDGGGHGTMQFYAWVNMSGAINGMWCQYSGSATDPDGAGATYTVSVVQ